MRADSNGRPPLASPETHLRINVLETTARALELANLAPKPVVFGRHLIALGIAPGPDFKRVLDAAFEAQLDGAFADETTGTAWLRKHLHLN